MRQAPAPPGGDQPRWRPADLREAVPRLAGYSPPGTSKAPKRQRVSRQRGRLATHSPALASQARLRWGDRARTVALLPSRRTTLPYGDAPACYRQPPLAPAYAPAGRAPVVRCAAGANRRTAWPGTDRPSNAACAWLDLFAGPSPELLHDVGELLGWGEGVVNDHQPPAPPS